MVKKPVNKVRYWLSFLFDVVISRTQSSLNEPLVLKISNGRLVLDGPHVNYAYGGLHDLFERTFDHLQIPGDSTYKVLILGFGVGDVAHILLKRKRHLLIDGVELDTQMIHFYKKFFRKKKYKKNIRIFQDDAEHFLSHHDDQYDLIVMDIFYDLMVPPQFQSRRFLITLKEHLSTNGILVYNQIVTNQELNKAHNDLNSKFEEIFGQHEELHILGNKPLVYRSSLPEDPSVNGEPNETGRSK